MLDFRALEDGLRVASRQNDVSQFCSSMECSAGMLTIRPGLALWFRNFCFMGLVKGIRAFCSGSSRWPLTGYRRVEADYALDLTRLIVQAQCQTRKHRLTAREAGSDVFELSKIVVHACMSER
eukprot:scaffold189869_cov32-Tisochrysis_lutea.AAC.2